MILSTLFLKILSFRYEIYGSQYQAHHCKGKLPGLAILFYFCRLHHADVTAFFLHDSLYPLLRFLRQKGNVNAL